MLPTDTMLILIKGFIWSRCLTDESSVYDFPELSGTRPCDFNVIFSASKLLVTRSVSVYTEFIELFPLIEILFTKTLFVRITENWCLVTTDFAKGFCSLMKQPEVILHRDFGHRQVFWQPNPNLGNTHGVEQSRPIYPTEHFSAGAEHPLA